MSEAQSLPVWLKVGHAHAHIGTLTAMPHPDDYEPKLSQLLRAAADRFDRVPPLFEQATHDPTLEP